jgi:2,5-furandicarboxylate decarboxylase 1
MGIDATAPINEEFAQRLIITSEQRSRAREILAGANVI